MQGKQESDVMASVTDVLGQLRGHRKWFFFPPKHTLSSQLLGRDREFSETGSTVHALEMQPGVATDELACTGGVERGGFLPTSLRQYCK